MHEVTEEVKEYVQARVENANLVWPKSPADSMMFLQTEVAEAMEVLLAQGNYYRNNPENKPEFGLEALGSELGDVIFMAIVTGLMCGIDPIQFLLVKMRNDARANTK